MLNLRISKPLLIRDGFSMCSGDYMKPFEDEGDTSHVVVSINVTWRGRVEKLWNEGATYREFFG